MARMEQELAALERMIRLMQVCGCVFLLALVHACLCVCALLRSGLH